MLRAPNIPITNGCRPAVAEPGPWPADLRHPRIQREGSSQKTAKRSGPRWRIHLGGRQSLWQLKGQESARAHLVPNGQAVPGLWNPSLPPERGVNSSCERW
jgi:hypothetical protein